MIERKRIAKTPYERFVRSAEDELDKFVRKELALQRAERRERAQRLRLPVDLNLGNRALRDRHRS
jgi:hypothetical protein